MVKRTNIEAVILAGGKSSRMGTSKAFLEINGKTMLSSVIAAVRPIVEKLSIIANADEYNTFGLPVHEDLIKGLGPAGGIYTALKNATTSKVLILSCDTPFISSELLHYICADCGTEWIRVPEHQSRREPLLAVYDTGCLNKLEMYIQEGIIKMQQLLDLLNAKSIMIPEERFPAHLFDNLNTPEDIYQLIQRAS